MAAIETTYGNGGVQTNTQGIPLTSGGDLNSVLAELVRRRMQVQQPEYVAQRPMAAPQRMNVTPEIPSVAGPTPKSALQRAQERDAIIKMREAQQGPPLRYSGSGFNLPQRLEMDDQHMSAYQRQMYLPEKSVFQPEGADTSGDRFDKDQEMKVLEAQLAALKDGQGAGSIMSRSVRGY